ncbi:MAG: mechanosensitive ion channel family protein [Candidatus Pacebacteria bacterium]|nr:mechanosensitive ion channel family protein [Candidatus Paceibacterota bacterium]
MLDQVSNWVVGVGPKVIIILVVAFFARLIIFKIIESAVRRVVRQEEGVSIDAEERRENTLIRIINGTLHVVIWLVSIMMILSEIGVEIGPILAAAGVVGIAVGFGGQYLIKDIISGFFIIIENQYKVGDVVCIGDSCGLVEDISLRMSTLRDLDGIAHHIPHGEVKQVSNMTKGFSRVNMNIGVSYEDDIEKVEAVINKIGKEMSADPEWKDKIREAPKFLRIDSFGDSSVNVKILGDTEPLSQWEVAGELRKRIKISFDREGISIPYPQRTISYLKD